MGSNPDRGRCCHLCVIVFFPSCALSEEMGLLPEDQLLAEACMKCVHIKGCARDRCYGRCVCVCVCEWQLSRDRQDMMCDRGGDPSDLAASDLDFPCHGCTACNAMVIMVVNVIWAYPLGLIHHPLAVS